MNIEVDGKVKLSKLLVREAEILQLGRGRRVLKINFKH
jgi:hypothetical protein